ncbi:helix-turn-helix transcriptional regulator [Christensenellaceae bacterium OttesenSCG-928-M15]|nr:helix-turn-helix transcriptional regulator [Christensenellaceae bacterium OttesenSCG-928-M15]
MHHVIQHLDDIPNFFRRFNVDNGKGNHEFYCQEFSYSAIYGNLKMSNLPAIMELVGIRQLPDIMFLIQLDDYRNIFQPFPEFNAFPRKAAIVLHLETIIAMRNIQGVVAGFVGHDTIGAYLRLEGKSIQDPPTRERVGAFARDIITSIREGTGESISIGISEFCGAFSRFPQAYTECKAALTQNFRAGKGSCAFFDARSSQKSGNTKIDLKPYMDDCIAAIGVPEKSACEAAVFSLIAAFEKTDLSPVNIRMQLVSFISRLIDLYAAKGFDEAELHLISFNAMKDLVNCNFMSNIPDILLNAFQGVKTLMFDNTSKNDQVRFRQNADECIALQHGDYSFNLQRAAETCNYSVSYFSRLFKRTYGEQFSQYLTNYRLEKAKQLLKGTSLSLQDIAAETGFHSTSYFCTVFKAKTGMPPRQFAAKMGQDPR